MRGNLVRNGIIISVACLVSFWGGIKLSPVLPEGSERAASNAQSRFHTMDRFVISVPGEQFQHYVQLELAIKSSTDGFEELLVEAEPLVQNSLMRLFTGKTYQQLSQLSDLDSLQNEVKLALTATFVENDYAMDFEDVLFTRLVVQ
ncbi:flagellar basal body-associated FliL family protein [Ferrimonas pelagia]